MKGTFKNLTLVATMAVMMSACSTMTTVVEKQQDVVPNWYMKCKDTGTEGWFWWSKDYYYACGSAVSGFKEGLTINHCSWQKLKLLIELMVQ